METLEIVAQVAAKQCQEASLDNIVFFHSNFKEFHIMDVQQMVVVNHGAQPTQMLWVVICMGTGATVTQIPAH